MSNKKVVHTLYSGLGGHSKVVFSLLETEFLMNYENYLVFYGVEKVVPEFIHKCKVLGVDQIAILKKPKQYIHPFKTFYRFLKKIEPDIIFIHSSELIFPAFRYKKKYPSTKLVYIEHEPNHTKTKLEKFITRFCLKRVDHVVCLNKNYVSELKRDYAVHVPITVIPNGVSLPKNIKKEVDLSKIRLGMAARMVDTKDHLLLVRAFKKLLDSHPNAELWLAGKGNLEKSIRAEVDRLNMNNNVFFKGLLGEIEMEVFFRQINYYVHTTLSETLSTSILQAMSYKLPIITSDIENNKQLIRHEQNGLLYKNKSEQDLLIQIRRLVNDHELETTLTSTAYEDIELNYTVDKMNKGYSNLTE